MLKNLRYPIINLQYCTNWRDGHAGLVRYARAHDRNHSQSSGGGSMCVHIVSEQMKVRQFV